MRVNTNIASLQAQRNLSTVTRALARSMERLSSGNRINSARDDASGLAVSNGLEAQVRAMRQATRNLNDAFGFLNTAEGAMAEQTQIVQRMRELAVQAANGTYSNADRANLDGELQELLNEYKRLVTDTDFNGTKLLDGSLQRLLLQVGSNAHHRIDVSLESTKADDAFTATTDDAIITTLVGSGAFTHSSTISLPASSLTDEAILQDFNGDTILDMAAINMGSATVSIRLGNGNGTFASAATLSSGLGSGTSQGMIAVDINGDSKIDLITYGLDAGSVGQIGLRLGNGDGTFAMGATLSMPLGVEIRSVGYADVNNDSKIDLFGVSANGHRVSVRLGNGDGTFSAAATVTGLSSPFYAPLFGDYNGDSKTDFLLLNSSTPSISVRLGVGDGTFSVGTTISIGSNTNQPVVGDINGDSRLDIVYGVHGSNSIGVRLGNGDGTFAAAATITLPVGSQPYIQQLADLNGDSVLDFVSSNRGDNSLTVFLGNGNGTFATSQTINLPAGSSPKLVNLTDLNGDSELDIIVPNSTGNTISIRLNNGDGTFSVASTITLPGGSNPNPQSLIDVDDLDGDDIPDIVVTNYSGDSIVTLLANTEESSSTGDGDLTVDDLSIATQSEAEDSLDLIDSALDVLASARAKIGAIQNRLESAASVSAASIESLSQARSQLVDSDVADETAEFAKTQILQQGTLAVLTNANLSSRLVLDLLKF